MPIREMREQWVEEHLQAIIECCYIELGYGRADDYRLRYGLWLETTTIAGRVQLIDCRTIELAEVGRTVLIGDPGAVTFVKQLTRRPKDGKVGPAIVCMEHRPSPDVKTRSITGVRPLGLPPRLLDSTLDVPVAGWEHLAFELIGDPYNFAKHVKTPRTITAEVRGRIADSYNRIVSASVGTDSGRFRIDPAAIRKAAIAGDIGLLFELNRRAHSDAERADIGEALMVAPIFSMLVAKRKAEDAAAASTP